MAVVSASTIPLLTDPMLRPPESTWGTVGLDVILTAEATGTVETATATTTGTGIGIEIVTAIVPRVATIGTVVTGTRIGTGVIAGAPVATRLIVGGREATLAARREAAPDVLVNANVTVIDLKILVVFCHRLPVSGMQVIVISKLSSFETPLPYCIKTSNSSCSVN